MATAFPESGGAYVFAKKVLTVRAAFGVGWVLWFAYIVAGVLYALGFAEYAVAILHDLVMAAGGEVPRWLEGRPILNFIAILATAFYTLSMIRKSGGGGQLATVGKIVIFALLLGLGLWALTRAPSGTVVERTSPFFSFGPAGLISAMGFTFIALQGFDLIPAIGGEVKKPRRNIPRAMLLSLSIGLVIYLPLLFLVATVGVDTGTDIATMSAESPATVMADAAHNFAGPVGYWMVMIAAVLSTLSALAANVLAASRVALTMARDRTLPRVMARMHPTRATPVVAIYASALALVGIILMLPNVAAAGAAASLIFLIAFALAHLTSFLARRRVDLEGAYRTPLFPAVQVVGGLACVALALFQAVVVPSAGAIVVVWLGFGGILYLALFAARAEAVDASAEAVDPQLTRLRGRSPLVLVPIANPANAHGLVTIADAIAPPVVGRVVLLNVMRRPDRSALVAGETPKVLEDGQAVVREALTESLQIGQQPETLMTIADDPWAEIARVARIRKCESLLLGMTSLKDSKHVTNLQDLLNEVECDIVVMRARSGWKVSDVTRVVVAVGRNTPHEELRARLLGSLWRTRKCPVHFVRVLPKDTPAPALEAAERDLVAFAQEESPGEVSAEVVASDDGVAVLGSVAKEGELLVLGLTRHHGRRLFGRTALKITHQTAATTLLISPKRSGLVNLVETEALRRFPSSRPPPSGI
jgi:amino acid transporter